MRSPAKRLLKRAVISLRDRGVVEAVLRRAAYRRLPTLRKDAVTVVFANWNSTQFLETGLRAVRRFASRPADIIVVDNHSAEPPVALVAEMRGRLVRLPLNAGHGVALDVGFLLAGTEYVMSLDVDAYPIDDRWLSVFLEPLDTGVTVVGCEWYRDYAHPCCLAMRTEHFVRARHTFIAQMHRDWDVGESISRREAGRVKIIKRTGGTPGVPGPFVGAVYGDVVYHNCYGVRHLRAERPDAEVLENMTRSKALEVWHEGLARFGPARWPPPGA